jgi:hypothetical protein
MFGRPIFAEHEPSLTKTESCAYDEGYLGNDHENEKEKLIQVEFIVTPLLGKYRS